jgi:uncharacterized protein (DUF58 family)
VLKLNIFKQLYLRPLFFKLLLGLAALYAFGYAFFPVFRVAQVLSFVMLLLTISEIAELFRFKDGIFAKRVLSDKFSNGDDNPIRIYLENRFFRKAKLEIVDEIPHQFQRRDISFAIDVKARAEGQLEYDLHPTKRGVYQFGAIRVFMLSRWGLCARRYSFDADHNVAVYPSIIQMRKYELLALSDRLVMPGLKKVRRVGQNREFEQINNYVWGDDYRRINWKATARRAELMVNQYQDERSQQVYTLIDKGRSMQMPFNGLSLLDYSINAALALSNVAIRKYDKAGLITFQEKPETIVKASARNTQLARILEHLYAQKTQFKESSLASLYIAIKRQVNQRSLMLLFTNFETVHAMERQLKYLRLINRSHLLVVVLFRNTELEDGLKDEAEDLEAVYQKGIAENLVYEKQLIAQKLRANGIYTLLTEPQELTPNSINAYLELRHKGIS